MAERRAVRCNLCFTKLCTFVVFFKWLFSSVFCNHYSKWRKNNSDFYPTLVILTTAFHFVISVEIYIRDYDNTAFLSILGTIAYVLAFWYVIQGKKEFAAINRAWHLGHDPKLYSKIHIPGHVKIVALVTTLVEICIYSSIEYETAWFLVAVLHCFSCYFLLHSYVIGSFPQYRNRRNRLVYNTQEKFTRNHQ